jgi:hypothetical protein
MHRDVWYSSVSQNPRHQGVEVGDRLLEPGDAASIVTRSFAALAMLLALMLAPGFGGIVPATAAETECPPGEGWVDCQAEKGDLMAVYVKGREAYETARTSGDFSEALAISRQLAAKGDKNGERLLKMVYIQLGWGAHRDYVQAYVWLSEGIAGGADYLVAWRKTLAQKMTPEQVAEAKKLVGG